MLFLAPAEFCRFGHIFLYSLSNVLQDTLLLVLYVCLQLYEINIGQQFGFNDAT